MLAIEPSSACRRSRRSRARERCPFAVIGEINDSGELAGARPAASPTTPVDMPLEVLLGKPPRMTRDVRSVARAAARASTSPASICARPRYRVLRLPTVADKTFLITIGDRTVGGLISRDQLVGPWQVPVSDVAVTLADYHGYAGEAMAMGERTPVAVLDAPASGRLAVAEAITNILAADVGALGADPPVGQLDGRLRRAGRGRGALRDGAARSAWSCARQLGIAIPVGKDSLSMKTSLAARADGTRSVVAPVSLIVSAFAPVADVRRTLTPRCSSDERPTSLWLIDLAGGKQRLGGSALAQVYGQLGDAPAGSGRSRSC